MAPRRDVGSGISDVPRRHSGPPTQRDIDTVGEGLQEQIDAINAEIDDLELQPDEYRARIRVGAATSPYVDLPPPTWVGVAAVDLGGHRAVYAAADGLRYASSDDPATAEAVVGVTLGAALTGSQARYRTHGRLAFPGSPFTPGDPVWLGLAGQLTQIPPTSGLMVVVGIPLDADTLHVAIQQPVILAA